MNTGNKTWPRVKHITKVTSVQQLLTYVVMMQVNELTMQNEYQLRLKDLAMNEKVKELTEKFTAELDVDKTKFDSLLQEKNEQELEFEEKGKQVEEKHQV